MPIDPALNLTETLTLAGYTHERDPRSDSDYRHRIYDAHGELIGRMDATEAWAWLAALPQEPPATKRAA